MSQGRLLIISNRLPFTFDEESQSMKPSSGGLVTAIKGIRWHERMTWLGSVPSNVPESQLVSENLSTSEFNFIPVRIDPALYDSYYNGLCNDVLWPLFHYESEYVRYHQTDWESYCKVNQMFCDAILEHVEDDDLVWVHDFQLFLLPGLLKKHRPKLRVGFFLHIPFPSSEVYRQLPIRSEIVQSLIAADLVGFHDYSYLRHFCSSVYGLLGIPSSLLSIKTEGHVTDLGVFPVSIDTKAFISRARRKKTDEAIHRFQLDDRKVKLILGVDRLDYTKGIDLKLAAFERLLEKHPELIGKVQLLQIAVPTRTGVEEYIRLKNEIEKRVGAINGRFSQPNYVPITYIYGSVNPYELMAVYRGSDVLFVGSKRDGMNLVCLEYLAVQDAADPGVIVLSEFAGAASTLSHALKINPWNEESTADCLYEALHMPLAEREKSFQAMHQFLESYTASHWAQSFVHRLSNKIVEGAHVQPKPASDPRVKSEIFKRIRGRKVVVLLDYDGTLVPIARRPELARLEKSELQRLKALKKRTGAEVIVISGRPSQYLEQMFGRDAFYLASDHGAKLFIPQLGKWKNIVSVKKKDWYSEAFRVMKDFAVRTPDSFIEKKDFSLVWHYRESPTDFATFQARKLIVELEDAMVGLPVRVSAGKKIVEVKAADANKGAYIQWMENSGLLQHENPIFICVGDDDTDEDMFRVLGTQGITIRVGEGVTQAEYRVNRQDEVLDLLEDLLTGEVAPATSPAAGAKVKSTRLATDPVSIEVRLKNLSENAKIEVGSTRNSIH